MNPSTTVRDAFSLRGQTLSLVSAACDADAYARATATIPAAAWRFFFAAEACATPVRQALGAAAEALSPGVRDVLDRACAAELQRMLAAQLQLAMIDRAAAMSGTAPILLKGGVPIAEGKHTFDLGDIDLLVTDEQHDALRAALLALGADEADALRFPGTLTTELHTELDAGAGVTAASAIRTSPLPRFEKLRRLEKVAHAAYVVQHCTTHHVERRGNIRDTMLLADELRAFSADDVERLRLALSPLPDGVLYERFLNRALCIVRRQPLSDDPATARVMAAHYALTERWPTNTDFVSHTLRVMTMNFVGTSSDLPRAARLFLFNPVRAESRWMANPLGRRAPNLWRRVSYVIRTPYRLALLSYAAAVAVRFRLDFDRAAFGRNDATAVRASPRR